MRNFKQNHEEMNWPWVESPFFNELIKHQELTDEQRELAIKLNKDGYVVLDLGLTDVWKSINICIKKRIR
jgi:predicted ATPase